VLAGAVAAAQRLSEAMQSAAVTAEPSGELEPFAELESVAELVVRDAPFPDHLRLRLIIRVHGEERVVDHGAV
jgi:hypothetical protein